MAARASTWLLSRTVWGWGAAASAAWGQAARIGYPMLDAEGLSIFVTVRQRAHQYEDRQPGQPHRTEMNEPARRWDPGDLDTFWHGPVENPGRGSRLTGSLPPEVSAGYYRDLMRAMEGINCILDAEGTELSWARRRIPSINPTCTAGNHPGAELRTLRAIATRPDLLARA
jgi:hypothetical protein